MLRTPTLVRLREHVIQTICGRSVGATQLKWMRCPITLAGMAARRIYDSEQHAQFVTFSCYKRRRLLDHEQMRQLILEILSEKLASYQGICSGYVVMPDHVHAIVWFQEPGALSRFMKGWKQTSSLELKKLARGLIPNYMSMCVKSDPFWQPKYFPFNLYSERKAEEKLNYMHENSVRAGLVERAVDWEASSARFYLLGEPGIVPVQWIFD